MVKPSLFGNILIFLLYFFWGIFVSGNGIAQTRYMLHAVPAHRQTVVISTDKMAMLAIHTAIDNPDWLNI